MSRWGGRKSAPSLLIGGVAALSLATAGSAHALVSTTSDAVAFATAMSAVTPTGGAFAVNYPCVAEDPNTPADEGLCPTAVSDTPLAGFPTNGTTYSILSNGNAALADDANTAGNSGYGWGTAGTPIGAGVYDYQIAQVNLPPATGTCLAFDFRFFSDEYPEYVDTNYNDAFIAQLDTWAVTADPTTQTVTAPGNFAGGAGDTISVDAGGPSAMVDTVAGGLGTTYDGATPLLTARAPVAVGSSHTLYLTIFDQGDSIYDSAAFLDNLRFENIDPKKCKSLADDPYEGGTGVTLGGKPKLAKNGKSMSVGASCDLPPGTFTCTVNAAATFTASKAKAATRANAGLFKPVSFAAGTATIPADSSGTITLETTKAGQKALKKAKEAPAKLKKKAKKLVKKAKELRADGNVAKAQKLEKKAKKLQAKAKKLKKKPLGVVTLTITNPANNASASYKVTIKR